MLRGDPKKIDRDDIISEAGDVLWNLANVLADNGIDFQRLPSIICPNSKPQKSRILWDQEEPLKVIQGNFKKDKSKTLKQKVSEGIDNIEDDEEIKYPFILIIDTGDELKIVSDIPMEKFNLMLDLVKNTILTGDYD